MSAAQLEKLKNQVGADLLDPYFLAGSEHVGNSSLSGLVGADARLSRLKITNLRKFFANWRSAVADLKNTIVESQIDQAIGKSKDLPHLRFLVELTKFESWLSMKPPSELPFFTPVDMKTFSEVFYGHPDQQFLAFNPKDCRVSATPALKEGLKKELGQLILLKIKNPAATTDILTKNIDKLLALVGS
jgi:hypothetical protein